MLNASYGPYWALRAPPLPTPLFAQLYSTLGFPTTGDLVANPTGFYGAIRRNSMAGFWLVNVSNAGVVTEQQMYVTGTGGSSEQSIIYDGSSIYVSLLMNGNSKLVVMKASSPTSITWAREIPSVAGETGFHIGKPLVTSDGGVVFPTSFQNSTLVQNYPGLIKFDSSGTQQWETRWTMTGSFGNIPRSVAEDNAGNLYLTTMNYSNNRIQYVVKFNSAGVMQWENTFTNTLNGNAPDSTIKADNSNNVYILSFGYRSHLTKLDSTGTLVWQRMITKGADAATQDVYCESLDVLPDGTCYITAWVTKTNGNETKAWFVVDSSGNLGIGRELQAGTNQINTTAGLFASSVQYDRINLGVNFGNSSTEALCHLPIDGSGMKTYTGNNPLFITYADLYTVPVVSCPVSTVTVTPTTWTFASNIHTAVAHTPVLGSAGTYGTISVTKMV